MVQHDNGKSYTLGNLKEKTIFFKTLSITILNNQVMSYYYRTWENFGGGKFCRIWRTIGNSPKFSPPIFIIARVFNKLPTDSPKFSSPKTLEPLIRQKFPPPKFSHVRYSTVCSWVFILHCSLEPYLALHAQISE